MLEQIFKLLTLVWFSFLTLLKVLLRSRIWITLPQTHEKMGIIVANGPSINTTLKTCQAILEKYPLICVNNFPNTAYYEVLKPRYFVLVAKELFYDGVNETVRLASAELISNLVEKTSWEIHIFLPYSIRKKKKKLQQIQSNPFLKIHFFNDTPVEGLSSLNHLFFMYNLGMPRPHNVLIPSLMISISMGFKEIVIVGADHSWLEELTVNDANQALLHQKHFYDEDTSKPDYMYKLGKRPRRLHEILEKFMLAFQAYFEIKDYATKRKVQIWNATPKSYIDAFDRKSLESLGQNRMD